MKCDVAVYGPVRKVIEAQLADANLRLQSGMMVRIYGEIQLSRTGTAQVKLLRLDTDAIVGNKAIERARIIRELNNEGLLRINASKYLSPVPLRICLVTSENSEGHKDFVGQLDRSAFAFDVQLRHSQVQGPTAVRQLTDAITNVTEGECDLICVVRGGGGELDAFDKEPIARAIANAPCPVWTGIGHTGDRSIADEVAAVAYITPTECGQGIVRRVVDFSDRIDQFARRLTSLANHGVSLCESELGGLQRGLDKSAQHALMLSRSRLDRSIHQLLSAAPRFVADSANDLQAREKHIQALNPTAPLRRGYSITRNQQGTAVRSVSDVTAGETLVTTLADGTVSSTVR